MRRPVVMIVDDDGSLVRALKVRCESLGLDVRTFSDVRPAVQSVIDAPPDLVLLDNHLPTGSGLAVCEALGADQRFWGVPVIIITGDSDASTRTRTRLAGARYVRKGSHLWNRIEPLLRAALQMENEERSVA